MSIDVTKQRLKTDRITNDKLITTDRGPIVVTTTTTTSMSIYYLLLLLLLLLWCARYTYYYYDTTTMTAWRGPDRWAGVAGGRQRSSAFSSVYCFSRCPTAVPVLTEVCDRCTHCANVSFQFLIPRGVQPVVVGRSCF